ncbi:winged helix-turn-helix transcriptional regulator [Motiliproteus coralliicola]|uniref:Leucine-responsive regulatory protein n=1 Tax=Motiliproteus coralliicola TaxID=2283196 RepID=A0A369WL21_9GAMM|nr:Lrp/AsnC ligand binding domain-containing protein [Motiliproteus coralliicola]RDE22770.1 winged helix-turn-helix transcriptional regulator [Motiliproteus coralliicola]
MAAKPRKLDRIDRNILRQLQNNGRMSYVDLAAEVGLSTTPCLERVRRLEKDGIIRGYSANLDPRALEAGLLVFVEISLTYRSNTIFEDFKREVLKIPQVMECHLVSGEFDYLIKARISEMSAYRELLGELLISLPNVDKSRSYIVMEEVKETSSINVPEMKSGD